MVSRNRRIRLLAILLLPLFLFSACKAPEQSISSANSSEAFSSAPALESSPQLEEEPVPSQPEESEPVEEPEIDSGLISAKTLGAASVYSSPAPGDALTALEAGTEVEVGKTDHSLWYSVTLENGTEGFLYGELLGAVKEDGTVGDTLFQESFQDTLEILKAMLPDGKYWNHMGLELPWGRETPFLYTDTPCEHLRYGEGYCNFYNGTSAEYFSQTTLNQCLGFASLLSDRFFGTEAPLHTFRNPSLLRVGDHIRLREYEHSMIVVEMTSEYIVLAEVNRDYEHCLISWSRQMTYSEVQGLVWDSQYISRYPMRKNSDGSFSVWEW